MTVPPQLRATWERRLRAAGFRDLETADGSFTDRNRLNYALGLDPVVRQVAVEYFDVAGWYLYSGTFASLTERRIWALHAEGATVREIATAVRRTKDYVQRRIEKHRAMAFRREGAVDLGA